MADREIRIAGDEILVLTAARARLSRALGRGGALRRRARRRADARRGAGRFIGGAGPGDVVLGTSFESNGTTHALIAVGVVPTILETWDLARKRGGAARRSARALRLDARRRGFDRVRSAAGAPGAARRRDRTGPRRTRALLAAARRTFASSAEAAGSWTRTCAMRGPESFRSAGASRCALTRTCGSSRSAAPTFIPTTCSAGIGVVHAAFWKRWHTRAAEEDQRREAMRRATQAFDERALRSGLEEATHLFERDRIATEPGDDPIVAAARIVAQADGITIVAPRESHSEPQAAVQAIAIESRLSVRRVRLQGGWHRREHGPMLAFRGPKHEPVALLPRRGRSHYVLIDPNPPIEPVRVDNALAAEIDRGRTSSCARSPSARSACWICCASGCATAASTSGRFWASVWPAASSPVWFRWQRRSSTARSFRERCGRSC